MKTRGKFEIPPKGYRGDTRGTAWDPNAMAAEFGNGESFNQGEV